MANAVIFPGSSSFVAGKTPFGFYDNDVDFITDADKSTLFCARRLGYPVVAVELQDINFYAAFEEAVTTYGNEVYAYKLRQDYLSLEGAPTSSAFNNALITPSLANIIRISEQYGSEAGAGGNITYHKGCIQLARNQQTYDLNAWANASASLDAGDSIEVKRVFYEGDPALVKYFDPYAGTGTGMMNLMDSFGWGNFSPAINFLLMPLNFDIQKFNAIELNDQIRKSNYSFEIRNNQLSIFPLPSRVGNLYFEYIKKQDRNNISSISGSQLPSGVVSNVSNVPYTNPQYKLINSVGRSWVYEYMLALCKEMLGYVRGKYGTIPIPGDEVTLNQSDLLASAAAEKTALIERLRGYLDETSRDKLLERRANEVEYRQKELQQVPFTIYIG